MGLKIQLQTIGSNYSQYDGLTPPTPVGATNLSTLHDQYSLNGIPNLLNVPLPSLLDLDGVTPPRYEDFPPL